MSLPNDNNLKKILPKTLRLGVIHVKPGEIVPSEWSWRNVARAKILGHGLAKTLTNSTDLDTSYGVEQVKRVPRALCAGKIVVPDITDTAKQSALANSPKENELSFWTNGSNLENQPLDVALFRRRI